MSTAWMLYWFTRLDGVEAFIGVLLVAAGALGVSLLVVGAISYSTDDDESAARLMGYAKKCAYVFFGVGFLSIWIPSQKDVAIIIGGQLAANIVQTPEAQELGSKVLQVINKELDGRISKKDGQ